MKSTFSIYFSEFKSQIKMRTRFAIMLISIFIPGMAFSQTESSAGNLEALLIVVIVLLMIVSVLVLVVAIYTLYVLRSLLLGEKERKATVEGVEQEQPENFWQSISKSLTKSTPVVEEESILMDHDYDGIRELDNHLPPWWKFLFYFTIVWAAVYLLVYHVFNVLPLSGEEYELEVAQATEAMEARQALMAESIDETNVEFSDDPVILANGESIFKAQCVVCHAADGGGGVGPNFTDEYWIHGGSIKDIFHTIKYGVPEKGMISWQSQMPPDAMRDVACYIYTLKGTIPANPKEPQGEIYKEEVENPDSPESEAEDSTVALAQ